MKQITFTGYHRLAGRAKKTELQKLENRYHKMRKMAPGQLQSLYFDVVGGEQITGPQGSRDRMFPASVTFWALLEQVFQGGSQRDALRCVAASCLAQGLPLPSTNTAAFSKACKRLKQNALDAINHRIIQRMPISTGPLGERRIMVVDGTAMKLADTPENQEEFGQPSEQQAGCGFPVMQMVGLYNACTRGLEGMSFSPHTASEAAMFGVELIDKLLPGDVLLADRGFCSYVNVAMLQQRKVDVLMRLNRSRRFGKDLVDGQAIDEWKRPELHNCPQHMPQQQWLELPEKMPLRRVRIHLKRKGFRTQTIDVVTSLMDASVEQLAELYRMRWGVEQCFDDQKTTLEMDFIDAKTPEMGMKMATMHVIAYNLICWSMLHAAKQELAEVSRMSFKGTLDTVSRYCNGAIAKGKQMIRRIWNTLLETVASDAVPDRPDRLEPRVLKQRPKNYSLMTKPRAELRSALKRNLLEIAHA